MGNIILAGYMGSGKTTIAGLLQPLLGMNAIDLDAYIEEITQLSIAEIFAQRGEVYFRKIEHEILKQLLANQNCIISLGGGTPCYSNNMNLLATADTVTIYLKASIETLFQRLNNQHSARPLLQGNTPEDMMEFIAKHLFERSFFYNQATYKVDTDHKTPAEVAAEIVLLLA